MCRLLPNEKPRQKKDFGTTSYKKPGPPTPSKNGGRLSLQGNEVQPLREQNQRMTMTPKKVTPSRIRALFMGRTNISRDNSEVNIDYFIDFINECRRIGRERTTQQHCTFCSQFISAYSPYRDNKTCTYVQPFMISKIWVYAKNFTAYCIFLLWRLCTISAFATFAKCKYSFHSFSSISHLIM